MSAIRQSTQGKYYLTGAFTLAGTSVVAGVFLSQTLGSFTITAVGMAVVLLFLLPFYARKTVHAIRMLGKRQWLLLFSQALFGIFLFRMFLLLGIRQTSAAEAGILTGTTPAVTAISAYVFLKEKPSRFAFAGIAATVLGILLLQGGSLFSASFASNHLAGNALVMLAAASESAFNIISRRQKSAEGSNDRVSIHPMVQTIIVSAIALCLSIGPAFTEHPFKAFRGLNAAAYAALLWYGLAVTALAFAFFYAGAKRCDAYTIAAFSGLMPLTSLLLSALLLGEETRFAQWLGCLLILSSALLISGGFGKQSFRYLIRIDRKG